MPADEPLAPPKTFLSYSWDAAEHQDWVLQLATRLRADGVDVVLDRWDTRLGSDLTLFMEQAANTEYRVVAIVTDKYRTKADAAEGGVGYERRVITPTLMDDLAGHRVIPVVRNNESGKLPRFFGAAKYVDMRSDERYENAYYELLQDLHGMQTTPKPPLGKNPFVVHAAEEAETSTRQSAARYVSPALNGSARFNHENNNGHYVIGAGERSFTLDFGVAGPQCVYILSDPPDIRSVALAPQTTDESQIEDASQYDGSSRVRLIKAGDAAVIRNTNNYWAAVFVDEVQVRETSQTGEASVSFRYHIPATPGPAIS